MLNRASKEQLVQEIKSKLENAKAAVIVDYKGLNVAQATALRTKYREAGVEFKIYKNTMLKLAVKDTPFEPLQSELLGPNAIAISMEDPLQPAKISYEFAKGNDKLELKSGVVDGVFYNTEDIKALAQVPPKEVLIAKLLGSFKAPISNFAYLVQAIADKQADGTTEV